MLIICMDSKEKVTKPQNLKEGSFKLWLPVGRLCACVCGPPEHSRLNRQITMMITMMVMTARMTARMTTNSMYRPVEASDGVILFSTLLLRNTQTHLEIMIFNDNDDNDDHDNDDNDPCKILATHVISE